MKKQLLLFVTGGVAVLLLLEIIFRVLPVSTATRSGYYIHPLILTYPPHHCFTAATGWDLKNAQHHCANNLGFLSDRNFVHDPQAVALIGDSFVEANMLAAHERLDAQLESRLADKPVYALGGPGSSLLDYAERAKFAAEKFGTKTFVFILERGDIKQALCGSGNIHGPCIDAHTRLPKTETQLPPGMLKRTLRESALAQYIFSQLKFDLSKSFLHTGARSSPGIAAQSLPLPVGELVVAHFFKQLSSIENAHFYFLIAPDRAHLSAEAATENGDLQLFKSAARSNHATLIEPGPAFHEFVSRSGRILEIGPYDRHWNRDAVQIIADKIAEKLR